MPNLSPPTGLILGEPRVPIPRGPRVLILGGTTQARELAAALAGRPVITSLAGRTANPVLHAGELRIGGFGGAAGLAAYLLEHQISALVDATHPFAATMSEHAVSAAATAGVPLLVLRRPGWVEGPGDRWHRVPSMAAALPQLAALSGPNSRGPHSRGPHSRGPHSRGPHSGEPHSRGPDSGLRRSGASPDDRLLRVFLTTGRQSIAVFAAVDAWFLARSVEPPSGEMPPRLTTVLARGPFTLDNERRLLAEHRIDVLVSKDSGGSATKLVAAREVGIPVVLIDRPPVSAAHTVTTVDAAHAWIESLSR